MRLWLICVFVLTALRSPALCQEQTSLPVKPNAPAARLEFRAVPKLDDGTWSSRAAAREPKSPNDWGFEEIIDSATGKPVSKEELDKTLFTKPAFLDGSMFKSNTHAELTGAGRVVIHFEFQNNAKETFKEYTGTHIGKHLGIFYDHKLISAPIINDVIPGVGIIEGNFTPESAKALADQLNGGDSTKSQAQTGLPSITPALIVAVGGIGLLLLAILYFWSRSADKPARPVEEVGGDR